MTLLLVDRGVLPVVWGSSPLCQHRFLQTLRGRSPLSIHTRASYVAAYCVARKTSLVIILACRPTPETPCHRAQDPWAPQRLPIFYLSSHVYRASLLPGSETGVMLGEWGCRIGESRTILLVRLDIVHIGSRSSDAAVLPTETEALMEWLMKETTIPT